MEIIKMAAIIGFVALSLVLIVRNYCSIFSGIIKNRRIASENIDDRVNSELVILKTSSDSAKKAAAFVSLMDLSYVLVHTLINKGNSYDDKIQSEKFRKSLTPEMMKRLRDLEGKYE